jgi:antitoxin ParD1/3/4
MSTLNISLPDNLREWIDGRVKKGDYSSASDYMRDLIRSDQKKHVEIDEILLEGINSGESLEATSAFWEKKRQHLKQQYSAQK